MKAQILRRSLQILIVLMALNAGIGLAMGWMSYGVERFCPFGGLETLWALATRQSFTCAMGPFNLALMMALLGLTLVSRRSFCAWVCPVGSVTEWLGLLGRKLRVLRGRAPERAALGMASLPRRAEAPLRGLRWLVLVLILLFTFKTGELIFRPYDPYYVLFSANGHDVRTWSYALLGGILLAALILPMAWCRYLCPLGAALWPFSRFAWLRIARDDSRCTSCGHCDRACPHGLAISSVETVRSGECTLCLECTSACPTQGSLSVLPAGLPRVPVPAWSLLLLLAAATLAGFRTAETLTFTSYEQSYMAPAPPADRLGRLSLAVSGVRCVDTAARAGRHLEKVDGLVALTAYAAESRLDITFDVRRTDAAAIIAGLESPVWDELSGEFHFQVFRVREILVSDPPTSIETPQRSIDS